MADISKDVLAYSLKSTLEKIGGTELYEMFLPDAEVKAAMQETLGELESMVKANFTERQGDWKPLKPSTVRQRLEQGFRGAGPKLVRSGTLRDNIAKGHEVQLVDGNVLGGVYPFGDAKAPYAEDGQTIDDYAEALNKERPFYDLSDEQATHLVEFFENALADKLGLTG